MGVSSYRPGGDDDHLATKTDILEDWPQRIAREQMIPRIAKMSRNALNVVPYYAEHFQRLRNGRRCSCFDVSDDAVGLCPLCFGTGVVGGYQKRGTKVDVFDVTTPYVVCVNTRPDYGALTRPVFFSLLETSTRGYVEFPWRPVHNIGSVDSLQLLDSVPEGTAVTYGIRTEPETAFVPLTEAALNQRLATKLPLRIRVDMWRPNLKTGLPKLVGIRCSYKTHKLTALRCDIPRTQRSRTLEEFGFYNSFNAQQFFFGNDLRAVDNSDFFVLLHDSTRWKVTEWQDNRILGINTSWDITCALVQNSVDPHARVPLGLLDLPTSQMAPNAIRSMQTETTEYVSKGTTHGRLPGERADIDKAHDVTVGVQPGGIRASKPIAER